MEKMAQSTAEQSEPLTTGDAGDESQNRGGMPAYGRVVFSGAVVSMLLMGCFAWFGSSSHRVSPPTIDEEGLVSLAGEGDAKSPASIMGIEVVETLASKQTMATYMEITTDIRALINSVGGGCSDASCPKGELAGCILRLAGHDFMDFLSGVGGSDGCINFNDVDNRGLEPCMTTGDSGGKLMDVWPRYRASISLADFFVVAAEAVMEMLQPAGSVPLNFKDSFKWGRRTTRTCSNMPHLPDPRKGCAEVEKFFMGIDRLGMTARESAALMGVHTLGRARMVNSGYDGWWSDPINSGVFNNNYYISILLKGWAPFRASAEKSQWFRVDERRGVAHEMMLNTDICLAFGSAADSAETQSCCAWVMPSVFGPTSNLNRVIATQQAQTAGFFNKPSYCGFDLNLVAGQQWQPDRALIKDWCCKEGAGSSPAAKAAPHNDCGSPDRLQGFAADAVIAFALDEAVWLSEFKDAWKKATELGIGRSGPGTCFPGHSHVHVDGVGELPLDSLRPGTAVLVEADYEPVLGYLHMPSFELVGAANVVGLVGS